MQWQPKSRFKDRDSRPGNTSFNPAHGVGQIVDIEQQEIAGFALELFVIDFAKDKMKLRVPVPKVTSVGMRKIAEAEEVAKSLKTVQGRARIKRTMWSRRAQEYDAKINSGDLIQIAEVVRDLFRSENQPEQSYLNASSMRRHWNAWRVNCQWLTESPKQKPSI